MKHIIIIFLLFLPATVFTTGEKIAEFSNHMVPKLLAIDDNQIYILEGWTFYIYSRKNFKPMGSFGSKGEGPGEFIGEVLELIPLKEQLMVNSLNKVSFFEKNGKLIKETNHITAGRNFRPAGKQLVGITSLVATENEKRLAAISLYDNNFKRLKRLYTREAFVQPGKGWHLFSRTYYKFVVCGDHIFICGDKEFIIYMFDINGTPRPPITPKYQRVKFNPQHGRNVLDFYKMRPSTKADYGWWEKNIHFPDYFPAVRDLFSDGDKLYVRTFKTEDGKSEFFIFNADGEKMKQVFLPIGQSNDKMAYPYMRDSAPFTIKDGKLYQLIADEEAETCALLVTNIL